MFETYSRVLFMVYGLLSGCAGDGFHHADERCEEGDKEGNHYDPDNHGQDGLKCFTQGVDRNPYFFFVNVGNLVCNHIHTP